MSNPRSISRSSRRPRSCCRTRARGPRGGSRTARASTTCSRSRPLRTRSLDRVAVRHARHVLLDDRPLVEVARRVVRGRADELHAALVGLVIGLAADERRQERVVDVDDPLGIALRRTRRSGSACSERARSGRCARARAARRCALPARPCSAAVIGTWWNGTPNALARLGSRSAWLLTISGISHAQLAGAAAQQQVVQAVVVLADQDRHALAGGSRRRAGSASRSARRPRRCARSSVDAVGVQLAQVEADALEELARDGIGVLIGVEDVDAVAVEQLRERGDQAFAVGARHEQGRIRRWRRVVHLRSALV